MEKVIIFDSGMPNVSKNNLFDRSFAYPISHTLLPICYLYEEAKQAGITCITPDVFLDNPENYSNKNVFLISHLVYPTTKRLIDAGAKPLLLTCQESPFIATRFYAGLRKYSGMFEHSMLFSGMKRQTSASTHFIPMFFPQFFEYKQQEPIPFRERKFITYIASNKEMRSLSKTLLMKLLYGFSVQLIYPFRRKIITFLSKRQDFDLYGKGWGNDPSPTIQKVYKGMVDNKEEVLRNYKFVLCLENAIFPGYITEKLFDCFFARSVPVYIGATDIDSYIPSDTFINIQDYKNLEDLESFLDSIDEETYNGYLQAIERYLQSESFTKWTHVAFAKKVLDLVSSAK